MSYSPWIYIFVMAGVNYLLRALPITFIQKQIENMFVKSVLYYLPYVTLAVMVVPAIFYVTSNPLCGIVALIATCIVAWFTSNLFISAFTTSGIVLLITVLLN